MLDFTRDDMVNTIGMISMQFTPEEAQTIANLQAGQEETDMQ